MKKKMMVVVLMTVVGVLAAVAGAAPVYLVDFDHGAQVPGPTPYVAGAGEIIPAGVVGTARANCSLADSAAGAFQGGQSLTQTLGAAWPNYQGYSFDGGPEIDGPWTLELIVNPDFTASQFGLSAISTMYDGAPFSGARAHNLAVDQNTGIVSWVHNFYSPATNMFSTTALVPGNWYHIAVVANATGVVATQQVELYVNGVLEDTSPFPIGWEPQLGIPTDFAIGSSYTGVPARNWQGQIDAFTIDNTVLAPGSFNLVPEPATLMLVMSGAGMLLSRRKRQS